MPDPGYSLVHADGSPCYRAPHDPACADRERFMAVRRTDGGCGIVDRRTGRLLREERKNQHRYPTWDAVTAVGADLNT